MNINKQISIKKFTRDLVSRPNETLGIAPRSKGDKLTALIKKLYAVILLVSQEQGDKNEYSIPLAQLIRRGNIDSKNTKLIREYLESMRRFSITWNTRKADDEYDGEMGIHDEEEPMIRVTFDIRQEGVEEVHEQTSEFKSETVKTSSQVVTTTTVEE